MYLKYFGFSTLPFENVPDPRFFYSDGEHAQVKNRLKNSIKAGMGLIVVTGAIGSGKTTLSQMLRSEFTPSTEQIWFPEPPTKSINLFAFIAEELGLKIVDSRESTFILRDIKKALIQRIADGKNVVVIIDECHLMTGEVINGIRLLNNLEENSENLIRFILFGQNEFLETIDHPETASFKQRIFAGMETLGTMNAQATCDYIAHRIKIAGGSLELFDSTAWEGIRRAFSDNGAPRMINSLCHRALCSAFEKNKRQVDVIDIYEASNVLGIETGVYFYIVELNSKHSTNKQESDKKAINSSNTIDNNRRENKRKSDWPVGFLGISVIALLLSLDHYCSVSRSLNYSECFPKLFSEILKTLFS